MGVGALPSHFCWHSDLVVQQHQPGHCRLLRLRTGHRFLSGLPEYLEDPGHRFHRCLCHRFRFARRRIRHVLHKNEEMKMRKEERKEHILLMRMRRRFREIIAIFHAYLIYHLTNLQN